MERSSGILLHISSLPGDDGIGSMGKDAFQFIDFLAQTKQKIWQRWKKNIKKSYLLTKLP